MGALCILFGIAPGQCFPTPFQWPSRLKIAQVNLPVGFLIWVKIMTAKVMDVAQVIRYV
ncbi:MAG: hypothetical protein ACUVR8_12110 [Acidobacteriota bacterium]